MLAFLCKMWYKEAVNIKPARTTGCGRNGHPPSAVGPARNARYKAEDGCPFPLSG